MHEWFVRLYREIIYELKAHGISHLTVNEPLHGPSMLVDKTNFGLVLYNYANFYRFEESSSY